MHGMNDEPIGFHDLAIGPLLKRLRGELSLRQVRRLTGISNSYLSEIEKGERRPGANLLKRLATLYSVDVRVLMERAGHLDNEREEDAANESQEVERAFQFVIDDPVFRFGTRPSGPLTLESKRFIVEMYERFSGKRLLS